jgi:signal transduction histidine kinase
MSKGLAIIGGIVVAIVVIAVPILIFWLVPEQALRVASYEATVVMSFFACGLLVVTIALVAAILVLVSVITRLTDTKVSPLLDKVTEATDSAKATVAYVGEGVVSPLVKIAAILAGIRGAIKALFRGTRV